MHKSMLKLALFIGFFSTNLSANPENPKAENLASWLYYASSDSCEGKASGVIVVTIENGNLVCVGVGQERRVWSVKIEGECIDVRPDAATARDFCSRQN